MKCKRAISLLVIAVVVFASGGCTQNQPVDTGGYKTILGFEYDSISIGNEQNFIVVQQDGLYGAYVRSGNSWELKIPIRYSKIELDLSADKFIRAYTGENQGEIYLTDGSQLTDETYYFLNLYEEDGQTYIRSSNFYCEDDSGVCVSFDGVKWGLLSFEGEWLIEPQYEEILSLLNDTYLIYTIAESDQSGDWVDKNGNSLLPTDKEITGVSQYSTNPYLIVAVGKESENYGIITTDGEFIVPPVYRNIHIDKDDAGNIFFVSYTHDDKADVYDEQGNILFENSPYRYVVTGDSMFRISDNGDVCGLISADGEMILPMEYDFVDALGDFILVKESGVGCYVYNMDGERISDSLYNQFPTLSTNPELAVVSQGTSYGFISSDGTVDTGLIYDGVKTRSEKSDLILLSQYGKWGAVDINLNTVIDFQYDDLKYFNENGYSYAMKDGRSGIIAPDGSTVVSFIFDTNPHFILNASALSGNIAVVWKDGKCGCIEITG